MFSDYPLPTKDVMPQDPSPQPVPPPEKAGPAIRTMKTDMEQMFRQSKPTIADFVQPKSKIPSRPTKDHSRGLRIFFILVLVLVLLGSGTAGVLFFFRSTQKPVIVKQIPPPLFPVEFTKELSVTAAKDASLEKIIDQTNKETERPQTITRLLVTLTNEPIERYLATKDFFEMLSIKAPVSFLDETADSLMPFFYHTGQENHFGVAILAKDSDRLFRELFAWESKLSLDLRPLFLNRPPDGSFETFEDQTYRNIDWRFLKLSTDKDIGIGYLIFPAKKLLIITTSKEAMETVINRLFNAQ